MEGTENDDNLKSPTKEGWADLEAFSAFLNENTGGGFMRFSIQSTGSTLSTMSNSRPTSVMPTPSRPTTSGRPRSQRPKTLFVAEATQEVSKRVPNKETRSPKTLQSPNIFEQTLPCDVRIPKKKGFDKCFYPVM
jgi:hypothetical protein